MTNHKLSPLDRNKRFNRKIYDLLNSENEYEIHNYISTIRSKTLRDICLFNLNYLKNYLFMFKYSPKELSKKIGISERKVYDLIKVSCFVHNVNYVGFNKSVEKLKK